MGSVPSRTGGREDEDKMCRSPERVRLSSVCPMAMSAGGEAAAFDLGEGLDVEGCVVLDGSMLPCIAQVVIGPREMVGRRRPSVVV